VSNASFAMPDQGSMRYLQALRRHWLLIATLVVVAIASAAVSSYTATKRYQASADLLIRPMPSNDSTYQGFNSIFAQSVDGSSAVVTAARYLGSPAVKRPCLAALPANARGASISLQPIGQADVVSIQASSSNPDRAAAGANAFATCAVANRNAAFQADLKTRIDQLRQRMALIPAANRQSNFEYAALAQTLANYLSALNLPNPTITLLSPANTPSTPVWPRPRLAFAASVLVGLLLGIGLAFIIEFVSPRVVREEELQLQHRLPILSRVPRLSAREARRYLTGQAPLPAPAWKPYRVLRAVLAHGGKGGGYPRTVVVTSSVPGDGKTTTSINLAITLAASNLRVILVDADVHRPMVASFFNVAVRRGGFSRLLTSEVTPDDLVQAPLHPNLKLVLAAQEPAGYANLSEERFSHLLDRLASIADVVVVDTPPLPEVAEVLDMASAAEAVLVAVRLGRTRRDKLVQLRELLARRGIAPAGLVVTTRDRLERDGEYDYPGEMARPTPRLATPPQPAQPAQAAAARRRQ
jgi:capsular exopolysaccharide synthesis family protein